LLSVIACIVRCACCGMSCCCSCFQCLKCCGDCCGCCDTPKGRKHKHLDEPYYPPQQGYNAPPPMMAGGIGGASAYEPPKYAQFETGPTGHALEPKKVSDDALPPMPSWETAAKKRVLTEEERGAMEMGELDPKTGQQIPLMSGAAGGISRTGSPAISPVHSPYGDRPGMNEQTGYMGPGAMGPGGMGPGGMGPGGMGPGAMGHGAMGAEAMGAGALGAGALGAGAMAMSGRGHDPYARNDPYGQNEPFGRGGPNDRGGFNGPPNDRYGPPGQGMPPMNGPGRGQGYNNQFPQDQSYPPNDNIPGNFGPGAAVGGAYSRGQPPRQYSPDNGSRPFPPQPQRQYSQDSNRPLMAPSPKRPYPDSSTLIPEPTVPFSNSSRGPPGRMASPPSNNSGFDFDDGNSSRQGPGPQAMPYGGSGRRPSAPSERQGGGGYAGSTAPPSYASRSPPPQDGNGGGYAGYQPYSAPQRPQVGRAPPSSAGRQREAQGWEVV
jgi:hypothetical protein